MAKKAKGNRVQVILECTEHHEGSKEGRSYTKVIKMVKSPKTGAYIFDEQMVRNEDVQNFFKK